MGAKGVDMAAYSGESRAIVAADRGVTLLKSHKVIHLRYSSPFMNLLIFYIEIFRADKIR